jgi:glycosyltransferase involved in cell wall biosynthesis
MVQSQVIPIPSTARTKPFIVVGIPAFNEEHTIASVLLGAKRHADVVVVCDDGSSDLTANIAEELGAFTIKHDRNRGKGWALRSIFEAAAKFNPDLVVTIDADGQHDPNEIPQIIKPLIHGQSDIVLGSRYLIPNNHKIPYYRQFGLHLINWLNRKANKSTIKDSQNGFRAYNSKALQVMSASESNGYSVESEQIILAQKFGLKIEEVSVSIRYEGLTQTSKKWPLTHGLALIAYLLKIMVEERPLYFLGVPGLISLLIGLGFGAWMFQIYSVEHYITTNIALAAFAFTLIGIFAIFAAITLYSIARLSSKITE